MRMGISLWCNNAPDNDRFLALESGEGEPIGDGVDNDTFETEVRFGDLIEPLGFDSLWTVEHHFNPYTMVPDPLQFLSFWAGRTERIGVGTMVVVLPWHHPVRVAEQISLLQHMLGDRDMMIGFGRGLGRREYGGLGVPMAESRQRFDEAIHIIKGLLGHERFAHQGQFTSVPDVAQRPESPDLSIRPRPRNSQAILDNLFVAWGSPPSVKATAHLGLQPLIIPQRGMHDYIKELEEFNEIRQTAGYKAANGTVMLQVYCAEKAEDVSAGIPYITAQGRSAAINYEFGNETLKQAKGYEYYVNVADRIGSQLAAQSAPGGAQSAGLYNIDESPIGTPEHCIMAIKKVCNWLHPSQIIGVFKVGGMPLEMAEKSLRLFAKEVLPAVHEMTPLVPLAAIPETA
jgi:alkanesulfonate monooxygenase SsuD/methylene tetrahydromethanopterin reductase-like flavin-dependent oxidoreductase (luciferase family)